MIEAHPESPNNCLHLFNQPFSKARGFLKKRGLLKSFNL